MKRTMILILAAVAILSLVLVACSKDNKQNAETTDTTIGLTDESSVYGFETETVTDENGKAVTDKDGKEVTEQVNVIYKTDKNGKEYAQKVDGDGKAVTDSKGNPVTVAETTTKATTTKKSSKKSSKKTTTTTTEAAKTTTEKATATTKKDVKMTEDADTTKFDGASTVPLTSDRGTEVNFSSDDQEIIASMLEVPYLYRKSYENTDGVPIETAVYTAVWMAAHSGGTADEYPANPVALNLFKFYGQTVVNFKTKCNDVEDTPIKYNKQKDKFTVKKYETKKQTVKITKIEDLGNDNYYKITGTVSNAGKIKKVVAVVQKNKLDTSLGFSIKALKWS